MTEQEQTYREVQEPSFWEKLDMQAEDYHDE